MSALLTDIEDPCSTRKVFERKVSCVTTVAMVVNFHACRLAISTIDRRYELVGVCSLKVSFQNWRLQNSMLYTGLMVGQNFELWLTLYTSWLVLVTLRMNSIAPPSGKQLYCDKFTSWRHDHIKRKDITMDCYLVQKKLRKKIMKTWHVSFAIG